MNQFQELKNLVASLEADANKFEAGNNAAGTRLRKGLQQVKVDTQNLRNKITEIRNAR